MFLFLAADLPSATQLQWFASSIMSLSDLPNLPKPFSGQSPQNLSLKAQQLHRGSQNIWNPSHLLKGLQEEAIHFPWTAHVWHALRVMIFTVLFPQHEGFTSFLCLSETAILSPGDWVLLGTSRAVGHCSPFPLLPWSPADWLWACTAPTQACAIIMQARAAIIQARFIPWAGDAQLLLLNSTSFFPSPSPAWSNTSI